MRGVHVATKRDYYDVLGVVAVGRATRRSRKPTGSSRCKYHPDRNPGDQRGRGALQGDSARPTRSCATPSGARSTTASATRPSSRAAAAAASISAAASRTSSATCSATSSATSRGRGGRGADAARRRTCATTSRSPSRRPPSAVEKTLLDPPPRHLRRRASGSGAKHGHRADDVLAVPRLGAGPLPAGLLRHRQDLRHVQRAGLGDLAIPCRRRAAAPARARRTHTLSVRIPPGVDTGSRLKLRGEGESGRQRRAAGRSLRRRPACASIRSSRATGTTSSARSRSSFAQAALGDGDRGADARRAPPRSKVPPGHPVGHTSSVSRARASPI